MSWNLKYSPDREDGVRRPAVRRLEEEAHVAEAVADREQPEGTLAEVQVLARDLRAGVGERREPRDARAQRVMDPGAIYVHMESASGGSSFWSVPLSRGLPGLLLKVDDPARSARRQEFATDGRRLFFTLAADESDIWVMELRR